MVRDAEAYGKYMEYLRTSDTPIGEILRTPKPDFTELEKEVREFEAWIREEHKKDRAIIARAIAEAKAREKASA